ncbi:DNA repair protein RecO [Methylomicrobium sp. Wu6]|uniref:DNA repair protein RecO n=1 Tax=Methylomicrobium sp. Wu6 TaxID=3107928 RepID=UPI002DD6B33B|nr:DNA repair protein RecO [Methylomicrobium sp. Wu6]MEC4748637.1 DNA repair protein RecO [Methylomicrobium sp. Wu6]
MTENRVYQQPAYILQQRNYRESSLIIEAFTRDFGRISVLAKGVRKAKSKSQGLLQPFIPLRLAFLGKAELKTLTDVELSGQFQPVSGFALYCGFYLNELITAFLYKDDPHPELFEDYRQCLIDLQREGGLEALLRNFELNLIEKTGYGLHLAYDVYHDKPVDSAKRYRLDADLSPIEAEAGIYSGKTLLAMQLRNFADAEVLAEAKVLLRRVLDQLLHGKPLNSRKVLNEVIKRL